MKPLKDGKLTKKKEVRLWNAARQERLATEGKVELWMWRLIQAFGCKKCQPKMGKFVKSYKWKDDPMWDERGR